MSQARRGEFISIKEWFKTVEQGSEYQLPNYIVEDSVGIIHTDDFQTIKFVRGSKSSDEDIKQAKGTLHEHLLAMMIADLKHKNDLVPSREGSLIITKLEEALGWMRQRQLDRIRREVEGTYKE